MKDHNGQSHEHRAGLIRDSGMATEQSVGFDYDSVDRALGASDETKEAAVEIFAAMLRSVIIDIEKAGPAAAREATYHRLAIGIRCDDDESMRLVAKAWGISVEAVSKCVQAIRTKHRLALNSFNKRSEVAAGYRDTNSHGRHI